MMVSASSIPRLIDPIHLWMRLTGTLKEDLTMDSCVPAVKARIKEISITETDLTVSVISAMGEERIVACKADAVDDSG